MSDRPTDTVAADAVPFFHDFSCRQHELDILRACFHATLSPTEVDDADRAALSSDEEGDHPGLRPLALVGGASGMGKSRLSKELRTIAADGGAQVEEVFCFERQGVPFLPILRVVKKLISNSPSRVTVWEKYSAVLGRVFPELAAELGVSTAPIELPGDDGRVQLFDALCRVLGEFSQERPLLILIHDLHRSDRGTLEFLEYLARNVFLDEVMRRREPTDEQHEEPDDAWKHIRRRDGRNRSFITDALGEASATTGDQPPARIMVIANYLQVEGDHDADGIDDVYTARLAAIEGEHVLNLSLPALDRQDTESLIRRTLGNRCFEASVVDQLHRSTGGNPFQLIEVCRCLFEEGLISNDLESTNPLTPDSTGSAFDDLLRDGDTSVSTRLIERRVGSLSETDAQLIRVLAVMRRPAQASVLARIMQTTESAVSGSLDRLCDRQLVREQREGDSCRYYLVHEDYVRVIYDVLDPEVRSQLHFDLATVLADQPRASEPVRTYEIYEHFRRSSEPQRAVEFGLRAAVYFAGAYAVDLAATIATSVLEIMATDETEREDSTVQWDVLELLARLELLRGEVPVAKGHVKRLVEDKSLPEDRKLRAYLRLAEIYRAGQESHKGIKALNRCLKQIPTLSDTGKAQVAAELARLRLDRQDSKRASNVALSALKDLDGCEGLVHEKIALLGVLSESHLARRESVSAIQVYQQQLELVEESGDPALLADVLNALGRVYYDRGNYFRAARYLFRALDAIRRVQDLRALSKAYDMLGKVYRNSGDTLRGIEYFHRSLRLRERIGDTEGLSPTLNSLGSLYAHRGEYVEAIRYFQRSVEISERVGDTAGIVRAFLHLGRSYLDVGELRQVESLAKQILILSQEFNLVELEGEGHRLHGDLLLVRGNLKLCERELRKAVEIATKRGRKSGEASATLSLGELLSEKEEWESALKQISKGQLLAEEIQSVPHQVRAQLLKGNVYRFLKGGNIERAKECFRRGLELVSGENQLPLQWELDYSISKVFQSNLEFVEAAESYRRAQRILDRIVDRLPENMRVTYTEDRRRKTFSEDYRRFEKEASGRMTIPHAELPDAPRTERVWRLPEKTVRSADPIGVDSDRIIETSARLAGAADLGEAATILLNEARRLVPAPSGFLALTDGAEIRVVSTCDMGGGVDWATADKLPGSLAREVSRTGVAVRSGGDDWHARLRQVPDGFAYKSRSSIVVPVRDGSEVRAVLYLERPSAQNSFDLDAQHALERLSRVVVGQIALHVRLDALCRYQRSRILTPAGFDEFLPTLLAERANGRSFAFIEVNAPGLDALLHETELPQALAQEIASYGTVAPSCVIHVTDDTFAFGYVGESAEQLDKHCSSLGEDFARLLERVTGDGSATVSARCIVPDDRHAGAEDLRRALWARLFRRRTEFDVSAEIGSITAGSLSLKEAKTALEKRYITAELQKSRGNITRAAESLGVHRPQLSNLIKKYNVRREDFE